MKKVIQTLEKNQLSSKDVLAELVENKVLTNEMVAETVNKLVAKREEKQARCNPHYVTTYVKKDQIHCYRCDYTYTCKNCASNLSHQDDMLSRSSNRVYKDHLCDFCSNKIALLVCGTCARPSCTCGCPCGCTC
jgi:hypothetical protein